MFQINRALSPEIVKETFASKTSSHNLLRKDTFKKRQVHAHYHGTESFLFLRQKIRDLVPVKSKQTESFDFFKSKIKNWVHFDCPCRLCKTYMQQVVFI